VDIETLDFKNQDLIIDKKILLKGYRSPKVISPMMVQSPTGGNKIRNRNLSMMERGDPFNGYYTPKIKLDMVSPKALNRGTSSILETKTAAKAFINSTSATDTNDPREEIRKDPVVPAVNLHQKFNSY